MMAPITYQEALEAAMRAEKDYANAESERAESVAIKRARAAWLKAAKLAPDRVTRDGCLVGAEFWDTEPSPELRAVAELIEA